MQVFYISTRCGQFRKTWVHRIPSSVEPASLMEGMLLSASLMNLSMFTSPPVS